MSCSASQLPDLSDLSRPDAGRKRSGAALGAILCLLALSGAPAAAEEPVPLTAAESDPEALGWMEGFPPPAERIIRGTDGDFFEFPKLRWTVCHIRQLMPTLGVSRGLGDPSRLPVDLDGGIDGVELTPIGGDTPMTWGESLAVNYTDGIIVLHGGTIVYERYFGCLEPHGKHAAMSVTKSFVGLLGEMLVAEGVLDESAEVGSLVPELAESAFGGATIRQVLEMTTGVRYSEDYSDPEADVWRYTAAASPLPKPEGYEGPRSYYEFLETVRPEGTHGEAFGYKTINTDVLGWVIARVTGRSVADLLSERIWRKMGAEQGAYFTVDSIGTPYAGGGLSAGLRDLARFGQLVLDGGAVDGEQLVPAAAIDRIRKGGDREAFAEAGYDLLDGWSYRGMWWVTHNEHGAFMARGVHGQAIYLDPTADMVIVRFASHPVAANAAIDPTSLPAYHAVAKYLMSTR